MINLFLVEGFTTQKDKGHKVVKTFLHKDTQANLGHLNMLSPTRFVNPRGRGILILTAYSSNYAPGAVCEPANRA